MSVEVENEFNDVPPSDSPPKMNGLEQVLSLDEYTLSDPHLNENKIFKKLRNNLHRYTVNQFEAIKNHTTDTIVEYELQTKLHSALRSILREVVLSCNKKRQTEYMLRVYHWYYGKLGSYGAMSQSEKKDEEKFIDPESYEKAEADKEAELLERKKLLMDEERQARDYKYTFFCEERTIHRDIEPARDRIKNYKRKMIPSTSYDGLSEHDIKISTRPVTQGSTRPTTKSSSIRPTTTGSQVRFKPTNDLNKPSHPDYNSFYTNSSKVQFFNSNRIEGKSSYIDYVPTNNTIE